MVVIFLFTWMDRINDYLVGLLGSAARRERVHEVVARCDLRALQRWRGVDLEEPDARGRTALHVALDEWEEAAAVEPEPESPAGLAPGHAAMDRSLDRGPASAEW